MNPAKRVPDYVSLRYVPEWQLPEPINREHRLVLWRIADAVGEQVKEGKVVTDTATRLRREGISKQNATLLARTALQDIYQDQLAESVPSSALTRVYNVSRRVRPTAFGLLIAAEDTRRRLEEISDRRTVPRMQRINQKSLAYLLNHPELLKHIAGRKS